VNLFEAGSSSEGSFGSFSTTFAAFLLVFDITSRFGALELTLGEIP